MPRYTPWTNSRYEVAPGLKPLGANLGNGEWDAKVFHFDEDADRLISAKLHSLEERPGKYRLSHRLSAEVAHAACQEIIKRLGSEWPNLPLPFSEDPLLLLDMLADMVPEDIALVSTDAEGDWLSYGSICMPSHWALEEKIGRSFAAVHQPIPGFQRISAVAHKMIDAMVNKGPWVRFVWSLESDNRPNHHPVAPSGADQREWWGREFERRQELWVRVERQCTIPLPQVQASLFTIRLYWHRGADVCRDEALRVPLLQAVLKMTPEEREYKGLADEFLTVCKLLDKPSVVGDEPKAVVAWVHDELAIRE